MRLLIIDDDKEDLELARVGFAACGIETACAGTLIQAIPRLAWAQGVLVDVSLPPRGGPAVAKALPAGVPVAFWSGCDSPQAAERPSPLFEKPADLKGFEELGRRLARHFSAASRYETVPDTRSYRIDSPSTRL